MADIPQKLKDTIEDFSYITTRADRQEYLIEIADRFRDVRVPAEIATKPYPQENHIEFCESDAYVWAQEQEDGTIKFYFDVLNPQGLSAMAMAVILDETASGAPLEEVAAIQADVVFDFFGKDISMGKGQGLMGIVNRVAAEARRRINN